MGRVIRHCLIAFAVACVFAGATVAQTTRPAIHLEWDRTTLRHLADGGYPRMIRLKSGVILLTCDSGRGSLLRRSTDNGVTWSDAIIAATFDHGAAANAEPLQLDDGRVWLLYNERPRDGKHPFTIRLSESRDEGVSWNRREEPLYVADVKEDNGCWEPAGVQLASGDLLVFFANESPYRSSDEQEITVIRSRDRGQTFELPMTFSFLPGTRDGMPVPVVLKDGTLVVSIEEEGTQRSHKLQPAILRAEFDASMKISPIGADDVRRWDAVAGMKPDVYAGAPYLRQLPTGATILSCHSDEGRRQPQMVVYLGDEHARNFTQPTAPFDLPAKTAGKWNALFVQDEKTVVALTTATIDGRYGAWAIDGHVVSGD